MAVFYSRVMYGCTIVVQTKEKEDEHITAKKYYV